MLWFLNQPHVNGLFNVGSGTARSFKDLAEAAFKAAGKTPKITYIDMPETLRHKYQNFTQANMAKLYAAGYSRPMTTLEDGVTQYIQDFMIKADPYR
jgi:ADP-L-glycero-D-manno-heptose 6-epimerase